EAKPGVYKVRLPLLFPGSKVCEETSAIDEIDAPASDERDPLALPKREIPSREIREIEDRIESFGLSIERVVITRRPKERASHPHPADVVAQFQSEHRCLNLGVSSGDLVVAFRPGDEIEGTC